MNLNLKNRFLFSTLLLILLGMSVTTLISYIISKKSLDEAYQSQITQLANSTSDIIATWIRDRQLDVKIWSSQEIYHVALNETAAGQSARQAANNRLAKLKEDYKYYENICIANAEGNTIGAADPSVIDVLNVAGESYFQEALKGSYFTSDVLPSNQSGKPVFIIACPIREKDQIKGVLFGALDLGFISQKYIEGVKIGQKGYAYMYQKDGTIIAHPDRQHVLKLKMGKFDFGRRMLAQGNGTIIYTFKGMEKIVAFKTDQVQGWTVAVGAATSDLMAPIKRFGTISLVAGLVVVCMAAMITFLIAKSIVKGINFILRVMRRSITQIAATSTQLSGSSQQLAEGASEQAASIEETSSSLEEMASMTRQNSENALQADNLMQKTNQVVAQTYGSMDQLMTAMVDISQASEETSKIIKTIDEIAFQTNLLALNAAVEAARAGEAGAGFAVVADEVRNLAMRAADAAKNTAELIEGTVSKIKEVSDLGTRTHDGFSEVSDHSSKVGGLVAEIAAASKEQAQGIEQVNHAVAAMDKVVQQNAASAQESASSSEVMTAQASQMEDMVARLLLLVAGSCKTAVRKDAPGGIIKSTAIHGNSSEKAPRPVPDSRPMNTVEAVPAEIDEFDDF